MAVCRFYQQGHCKYGNSCKFEHPGAGGSQYSNRFSALSGGGGGGDNAQFQRDLERYSIKLDMIESDLTTETPSWILSSYGPARDLPDQLFGGYLREQSFEEMRLHYMRGKAEGNEQKALAEAQELYQNAQAQMQTAVQNVSEAARYLIQGEHRHPNRLDICRQNTRGAPFGEFLVGKRPKSISSGAVPASANPFAPNSNNNTTTALSSFGGGSNNIASSSSSTTTTTTSAFGQPSMLGQKPNPFGTPTFGQPAQPVSGFGQPSQPVSAFGQPSQTTTTSGFGQPSALGARPNPFGAPSQPSAFGQPSQSASNPSPFGQASQPNTTSAFGQPSALGTKPNPFGAPAFGQPAQPSAAANNQTSAFGQTSQLGQKSNPFGGNANAGPSPFATTGNTTNNQSNNAVNPFGAPQANNQGNPAPTNPFGSPSTAAQRTTGNSNSFGQPSTTSNTNPFASGNSTTTTPNNPFATAGSGGGSASNPFAITQPAGANQVPGASNPFGAAPGANVAQTGATASAAAAAAAGGNPYAPESSKRHPAPESYMTKNADGSLAAFKGKAVTYNKDRKPGIRAFDGTWTRIWFPNGPPGYYKDTELPLAVYDDETKRQWQQFEQTGVFADGMMPLLPPLRESTKWDF